MTRILRFLFLGVGGFVAVALANALRVSRGHEDEPEVEPAGPDWDPGAPEHQQFRPKVPRRFLTTLAFVSVFFAGASFVAGAGDQVAKLIQADEAEQAIAADPAASDPAADASADPAGAEPAPEPAAVPIPAGNEDVAESADPAVPDPGAESAAGEATSEPGTDGATSESGVSPDGAARAVSEAAQGGGDRDRTRSSRLKPAGQLGPKHGPAPVQAARRVRQKLTARKPRPDPEVHQPGVSATIWLNRALPDPTPPAKRLTQRFAARLVRTSRHAGADWALVLGVLRAEGATGSAPAGPATLGRLSRRLVALESGGRNKWEAAAAFAGDTAAADRAVALGRYYRAVGLWALVHGLQAAKGALVQKVLADPRVLVYPGGRTDLERGRVDVRVVAVIAYMAESFGQVQVSSLVSGHRLYARPGVVSAHVYGRALDISALGGQPIQGNQGPGGVTEHAVRDLLLLPPELLPRQVISLLGLGGPSFALANHYNHIHVGY